MTLGTASFFNLGTKLDSSQYTINSEFGQLRKILNSKITRSENYITILHRIIRRNLTYFLILLRLNYFEIIILRLANNFNSRLKTRYSQYTVSANQPIILKVKRKVLRGLKK